MGLMDFYKMTQSEFKAIKNRLNPPEKNQVSDDLFRVLTEKLGTTPDELKKHEQDAQDAQKNLANEIDQMVFDETNNDQTS